MIEHKVIAVYHAESGFTSTGYGNTPEEALEDLESLEYEEFLDYKRVTFYSKMSSKIKMVIE